MLIKVALLQMTGCGDDKEANRVKGTAFCRKAKAMGADIALFPEMWSVGMTFFNSNLEGDRQRWESLAISQTDSILHTFSRTCQRVRDVNRRYLS